MDNVAYIRKRELELEIECMGSESKEILAMSGMPFTVYDEQRGAYRALPCVYWTLKDRLSKYGFKVKSELNEDMKLDVTIKGKIGLRPYQKEALDILSKKKFRGVVVLPTGAGKSIIGIQAIGLLREKTLVVVPTLELMEQWRIKITRVLGIHGDTIGMWGGGKRELRNITITTYQSACRRDFLKRAMDSFNLIIFDEAHHLPAATYIEIAKRLIAKHRIGLTATPERLDRRDRLFPIFVGDIIRCVGIRELIRKGYLSGYDYEKIEVFMSKEEREKYLELMKVYREYIKENFPKLSGRKAFEKVIRRAWLDRRAKIALECRMKAKSIAMAPFAKISALNDILHRHRNDKVIIFTRLRRTAHLIGYTFGIPVITSETPKTVRREIFSMFRTGKITKIVSAEALDEGIDVPDASVGIIVSGTSSERQYIQRVGRVLRPKERKAKIYELVTARSFDVFLSKARKGLVRRD